MKRFVYLFAGVGCFVVHVGCSSSRAPEIRALMQTPVAPASDALFNAIVYTNGQLVSSPQTDEQWNRLRAHADSLRSAAVSMKGMAPAESPGEWLRQSDALTAASSDALRAIDGKNLDAVLDAGGRIYATCTACHAAYVKE